jgi:hypothetical protein
MGVVASPTEIVSISRGSTGIVEIQASSISVISLAEFDTRKKRLENLLDYQYLMQIAAPVVKEVRLEGNTAILTLITLMPYQVPVADNPANSLMLLLNSVNDGFKTIGSPQVRLNRLFHQLRAEHNLGSVKDACLKFAGGIIMNTKIEKNRDANHPDFDTMDNEQIVAQLKREPWTTWILRIAVSDPAWIEHLPDSTPYLTSVGKLPQVEARDGNPLVWTPE